MSKIEIDDRRIPETRNIALNEVPYGSAFFGAIGRGTRRLWIKSHHRAVAADGMDVVDAGGGFIVYDYQPVHIVITVTGNAD